jgi:hypothetical protein
MSRITFATLENAGREMNLVIERVDKTCDGDRYYYSCYDNDNGTEALCENIDELHQCVYSKQTNGYI